MCHHDKRWVENTRDRLAENFNLKETGITEIYEDEILGVSAYKTSIKDNTYTINIYGIVYGPSTLPVKREYLCKDVSKETVICHKITYNRKRASLNSALKDGLLNDCLADAVIYLGSKGELIRKGVKRSLLKIKGDIKTNNSSLFFLSESLGSKVLRDSLLCNIDKKSIEVINLLSKSSVIYLGANQIPLLNSGNNNECIIPKSFIDTFDKSSDGITGGFDDILNIIKQHKEFNALGIDIPEGISTVISFTDPNDLLSYEISNEYGENEVINVIVSNSNTWFGFIQNPVSAHLGYRRNEDVINLLKCGMNNLNVTDCMSK
ncbi:MAG: hypothetical protein DBP01_11010 [gamma proteobacterium symbiont of Ctena orbiculata]|nr:MAG: hypothetical protein DBP01_11010 [gamma proteobacterium symbiont of Ctena orbiculata]